MSTALSDNRPALRRAPLIVTGVVALAACLVTVVVGGAATTCPPR